MKKVLKCIISIMIVFGNLCVFLGGFFTFAKGYDWYYAKEKIGALIQVFEYDGYITVKTMLVVMWLCVYASLIIFALRTFTLLDKAELLISTILVVFSFVGKYCFGKIVDEFFLGMYVDYIGVGKGTGYVLIDKAYIVLIFGGLLDVALCIYNLYFEKYVKDKRESFMMMKGALKCPKCGQIISGKSKFCGRCGFSMEIFKCAKCGTQREAKEQFCKECGERLPAISELYDEEYDG